MAKLSVGQALLKAKSHIEEAQKLYHTILRSMPDNIQAQQSLNVLNNLEQSTTTQGPPQETINQLVDLYNQGQLTAVVEQAQVLTEQYPKAFIIWNVLGAAHKGLGKTFEASEAFKKVTELNPTYADGHNNLGVTLKDQGKLAEAIEAYNRALSIKPDHANAYSNMGVTLQEQGKLDEAIEAYNKATELKPDYADAYYNMGVTFKEQDKLEESIEAYNKALAIKPDYADAYYNMGVTLQEQGKLDEAIAAYKKALALKPDYAQVYNNIGNALKDQGKLEEAIEACNKATELKPDYADAYYNMGVTLKDQGKLDEAIAAYDKALLIKPDHAEAYNNMGNALKAQVKLDEAIAAYNKALSIKPDYAEAYYNMGNALKDQGKLEEAIEAYEKALALKSDYADAYNNMGTTLQEQGKLEEAIEAYEKALALKPDYAEAYNNMGITLKDQCKLEQAIEAYNKALAINPDYAEAYNNMGAVLQEQGKLEEAIEAYKKALALKPDYEAARAQCLYQLAHICDWSAVEADQYYLPELGSQGKAVTPFSLLSLEDAPDRHRLRSVNFAREKYPQKATILSAKPIEQPKRLRIGYFSADFHNFAGMHLMIGMLERHDRSKFEIYAFSYGPEVHDKMRMRIVNAVDHFIVIQSMPKDVVFEFVEEKKIDIAIHRNGYTKNSRTDLFSSRLAPIQINYLGYPGTLGAEFMDYIIADPIVIPEDMRQHYSEQIMYLPHTYQPNDNTRVISQKVQTKEDMGLPSDGFVFCCFNNNYKISPKEFDIWMRVMAKVEGSVLWLLKSNKWAEQNLKREAEARGISADRVIFAERVKNPDHLARHKLADLFLDTFNYNAHTTASDALWAGLPLVTKLGESFAARVAGSLLSAVGLPELITHDEKAYEALILKLATSPKKLAKIKKKLATNRLTQPLFDTEQYTKHLEKGYQQAYQKYFNGDTPDTIMVPK